MQVAPSVHSHPSHDGTACQRGLQIPVNQNFLTLTVKMTFPGRTEWQWELNPQQSVDVQLWGVIEGSAPF